MTWWHAVVLGIVEGLTEFLPVSSTGHVTIVSKLLGYTIDDPDVTAFTAIIQIGAIVASVVYFRRDIVRMVTGFARGLVSAEDRQRFEWRLACAVIAGSIPIGIVALLFKDTIEGTLRSLWVVAIALILWSVVMAAAERYHSRLAVRADAVRHEQDLTVKDALIVGVVQCLALIPGISRSGATISTGLFRGLDRVTATRLAFFLAMPALSAAAVMQAVTARDAISQGVGWGATLIGIVASFVVGYAAIAWLLRFVAHHSITVFVWYRVALGVALLAALGTGALAAH
jgi:undecaprenyl-diphosphatase